MNVRLAIRTSDLPGAQVNAAQLLANAEQEWGTTHSADARLAVASARLLAGETRWMTGDRSGATSDWQAGAAATPPTVAADPYDLSVRAILLARAGQREAAAQIDQQLAVMGFRDPRYLKRRASTGATG